MNHRQTDLASKTVCDTCTEGEEAISGPSKSESFKNENLFNEEFLTKVQEKCEKICKGCKPKETNICEAQD